MGPLDGGYYCINIHIGFGGKNIWGWGGQVNKGDGGVFKN